MINLHLIAWDVTKEPDMLEEVSSLGESHFYDSLRERIQSFVILSTCHRLEIYSSEEITEFEALRPYHRLEGYDAIRHLFRVASGVESVSVGEQEILRQVKTAFEKALKEGKTSKEFSIIFRKAISVGKEARDRTGISKGRTSIPSLVGQMLVSTLPAGGKRIAVVGTGKIARDMVKYGLESEPGELVVYGRSQSPLQSISDQFGVRTILGIEPHSIAAENDIVIAATSSSKPLFPLDVVEKADCTFIDLGMPPNVEKSTKEKKVISLSDLEPIIKANSKDKESKIPAVERIISEGIDSLSMKLGEFQAEDLIKTIFNHAKGVEKTEIADALAAIHNGMAVEDVLKKMSDSLINQVLAPQTLAIKKLIKSEANEELRKAIITFYNVLKESQVASSKTAPSSRRANRSRPDQILQ